MCTAILACNDNMANGAMQALNDAGRRVPDDVSIIGFDDSLTDSVPHTILSSIRFDHQKLGARAFEEVLDACDEKHRILIPGALIERGSIRPRS
jgi:DNA-binding LacI/PurR family transcriptional regulator